MSASNDEIHRELKGALSRLEEGKRIYEELAASPPDELIDAVARMNRSTLEMITIYQLLRLRLCR